MTRTTHSFQSLIYCFTRCTFALLAIFAVVLTTSLVPLPAYGQISKESEKAKEEPALPETDAEIETKITSLQKSHVTALGEYLPEKELVDAAPSDQPGAAPGEANRKARQILKRMGAYRQHIDALRTLQKTRQAFEDLSSEIDGWQGFEEYTISLVDELRNTIHAEKLKIRGIEVNQSIAQDDLADALTLIGTAETNIGKASEAHESAPLEEKANFITLVDLATLQKKAAEAEFEAIETKRLVLEEVLAYHNRNLEFLQQKLQETTENVVVTEEDREARFTAIKEARTSTENELKKATGADLLARDALRKAREALERAEERIAKGPEDAKQKEIEIEKLQRILDSREAVVETTGEIVEGLRLLLNAHEAEEIIWKNRLRLYATPEEANFKWMIERIDTLKKKTLDYQFHFESKKKLSQNLIMSLQNRLTTADIGDNERNIGKQILKDYQKRMDFSERALARINEISLLLDHWQAEVEWRRSEVPLLDRVGAFFASISDQAGSVWNYELFSAEDTFIIDGRPITAQRPVTVSKVVRALIILVLGLWIGSFLGKGVQALSLKYFKTDRRIAELIEKGFRVAIILLVIIIALVTVKIPLTIFAFLGGALAIGVGFGAQNLINNFISGIILLFERPIKVGDIVEVEGTRGRVVSIGGRCSQVRRFDGIDILVPNSSFLEKNVVNWTLTDEVVRLSVTVGVAYGSPTQKVADLIAETVDNHEKVLKNPTPVILFADFGDSSLVFTVYFWSEVSPWMDFRIIASDLRHAIDERFDNAGITIAFPQRDVHLDSLKPVQVQITEPKPPEKSES